MTRALARELGSRNITVNCVAPGFIDTDMTGRCPEAQQQALLNQIPLGHLGAPADIAHAVAFSPARAGLRDRPGTPRQRRHVHGLTESGCPESITSPRSARADRDQQCRGYELPTPAR